MEEIQKNDKAAGEQIENTAVVDTPPVMNESAGESGKHKKSMFIAAMIIVVAIAAALFLYTNNKNPNNAGTDVEDSFAEIFQVNNVDPVAVVNGISLSASEYARSINEVAANATSFGADIQDPAVQGQIKEQAIIALLNTELLHQAATVAAVTVSTDAVATEYANIIAQLGGEEALKTALESFDLTAEQLQENIEKQLAINTYIDTKLDPALLTVSEEEIVEVYDNAASSAELPPFEEVRAVIESQLIAEKQQDAVLLLIEELEAAANIERLI